jgi:hypothetical protein
LGDAAACADFAQLGHVPVGVVDGGADERSGVRAASDFAQLVGVVVEIRSGDAGFRFRAAVAIDVIAVGLGSAVAGRGEAVEVVVAVAPGLGRSTDDFGLAGAPSLLIQAVEMAGENRAVEQVLFLLEAAVLEPALRGALAAVETLLDQPPAGVVGEGDGLVVGGGDAGETAGGVVAEAGAVAVAVFDSCQSSAGGGSGLIVKEQATRLLTQYARRNEIRTRPLLHISRLCRWRRSR